MRRKTWREVGEAFWEMVQCKEAGLPITKDYSALADELETVDWGENIEKAGDGMYFRYCIHMAAINALRKPIPAKALAVPPRRRSSQ